MATRLHGTLASWNAARGYGFITPQHGGSGVFVHIRAFPRGSGQPTVGDELTYEVEKTADGKTRARFVTVDGTIDPAAIPPRYGVTSASIVSFLAIVAFAILYSVIQLLWHPPIWVLEVYIGTSLLCFVIYLFDKQAAAVGRWRVSETALLLLGLAGGWPGAIIAQQVLRHKTKKRTFQTAFAGTIVANVLLFAYLTSPLAQHLVQRVTQNVH